MFIIVYIQALMEYGYYIEIIHNIKNTIMKEAGNIITELIPKK